MIKQGNTVFRNLPEQVEYNSKAISSILKVIDALGDLSTDGIQTEGNSTFGANVEIDGNLTLNSKNNLTFKDTSDTLVLSSDLLADYNTLDTKIEANSALIDTKQDKIKATVEDGVLTLEIS